MKAAWSPTNFHTLKMVWRKTQPSSAGNCNYVSYRIPARRENIFLASLIALNIPKAKKEQPWSFIFSSAQFADIHIDLESFTQTNPVSQWQHCQARIITATTDSELLLGFTTSSPSFFCLAEFLALTASSGNKFYQ